MARVGEVRRPHWAHESGERCDEWWEEESDWRDGWLQLFSQSPNADIENVLEKNGEKHFYDVRFGDSLVAVFRRTRLPPEQFVKRKTVLCLSEVFPPFQTCHHQRPMATEIWYTAHVIEE